MRYIVINKALVFFLYFSLCAKVLKEQVCSLVERAKQQPMLVMTTIRMVCVLTVQCPGRYEYLATQLLSFCTNNEVNRLSCLKCMAYVNDYYSCIKLY